MQRQQTSLTTARHHLYPDTALHIINNKLPSPETFGALHTREGTTAGGRTVLEQRPETPKVKDTDKPYVGKTKMQS
jgi:hypothetical protein